MLQWAATMSRAAPDEGLCGAGAEGPARKRHAATADDVPPVVLAAVVEHLHNHERKALLASSLLAGSAPWASSQQQPCIVTSAARGSVGNAVCVIKVRAATGPRAFPGASYSDYRSIVCAPRVPGVPEQSDAPSLAERPRDR